MKRQCSSSLAKLLWFVALRYLPSALSYKWRGQFAGSDFLQLPFRYDGYDGFFTCFSLVAAVVSDRSSQIFTALSVKNQELFTLTLCSEINMSPMFIRCDCSFRGPPPLPSCAG